jgi:hypothetical protein
MTVKRSENPFDLCQFQFANGKCCGMPAHPKYNGLCLNHGTLNSRTNVREDDLFNFMAIPSGATLTQEEIQRALGRVFEALASNRISTRRASTLAYLGFLMLQTYSGLKAEARMTELQGAKDLRMLLQMKYGPPLRKEAVERLAERLAQEKKQPPEASSDQRPVNGGPKTSTNPKST